jgi:hypothetical protein
MLLELALLLLLLLHWLLMLAYGRVAAASCMAGSPFA